jgi:hypothetical protein
MTTSHDDQRYRALKDELRRLRRPSAPWYLEGEIHRRLHHPGRRTPFIGVAPILMIAATFVTISIAAYLLVINPVFVGQDHPASPGAAQVRAPQADTTSHAALPPPDSAGVAAGRRPPAAGLAVKAARATRVRDSLHSAGREAQALRRAAADSAGVTGRKAPSAVPAPEDVPVLSDTSGIR